MKTFSFLILLIICTTASNAQEVAELYQVEVVVFKQMEADAAIAKIKDLNYPQSKQNKQRAALDLSKTNATSDIRTVPYNQLQLSSEAQKIKLDNRYQLLYHSAWQQPPYHRAQTPYINILNAPQNGLLKGTAWVSYERYFKLILDFQYDPDFDKASEVVDTPQTFSIPIHLERTMSDEKLFYIDHPIIGVITLISPLREP